MASFILPLCLAGLAVLGLLTSGCGQRGEGKTDDDRPLVVCTTTMIADMTRELVGPHARVAAIMKPRVDPHIYDPTPEDSILFRNADLILVNGLHLEGRMLDMIQAAGNRAVRLGEDSRIKLRNRGGSAAPDPHVWWNARYFGIMTERAAEALAATIPAYADLFRQNAARYRQRLERLHEQCQAAVSRIPAERRYMITSHDAFYYFGEAYGMEVDAVLGISTDAQANAAEPMRLARIAAERRLPAVFHETSVTQALNDLVDLIQRLAKDKYGHELRIAGPLYSDSLGAPGEPAGTYAGAMKANVCMIVEALSGQPAEGLFEP